MFIITSLPQYGLLTRVNSDCSLTSEVLWTAFYVVEVVALDVSCSGSSAVVSLIYLNLFLGQIFNGFEAFSFSAKPSPNNH